MSYYCTPCERHFDDYQSFRQHVVSSCVRQHQNMTYICETCNRTFNTLRALEQHEENSPAHRFQSDGEESYSESTSSDDYPYYQQDEEEVEEEYGTYQTYDCNLCNRWFNSEQSLHQHCRDATGHPYCVSCKRMFQNENNLMQHLHSRKHVGEHMACPFCNNNYTTASGVIIHLESGTCTSGMNRQKINEAILRLDRNHVITKRLLTMPGRSYVETFATERSWNGRAYACYLCPRQFGTLQGVNAHLRSSVHEQNLYRCPNGSCRREYRLLSGLVQHVESESCGLMRFHQVQQHAHLGLESMVDRLLMA